jgi:hypothetical protein
VSYTGKSPFGGVEGGWEVGRWEGGKLIDVIWEKNQEKNKRRKFQRKKKEIESRRQKGGENIDGLEERNLSFPKSGKEKNTGFGPKYRP